MRSLLLALPLGFLLSVSTSAQMVCDPTALPETAHKVAEIEKLLHNAAVPENDPVVPRDIATQLAGLKAALQESARAAFACAPGDAEPETLQKTLAEVLHAHDSAAGSSIETRGKKDVGTYGADLSVQVFPLFGSPRYYEVDFRYGVECGDDNLLLIFAADRSADGAADRAADKPHNPTPWHQVLRWDSPRYNTVADAFGDFIMMTPLSGFPGQRNWRFVVAHGQPGCGPADGGGEFALDILEPTADPAQPAVVWHLQHPYRRNEEPRLSTTEDTLTFELSTPANSSAKASKTAKVPAHTDTFRYRISKENQVEAIPAGDANSMAPTAPTASSAPATNTHSPQ